MSKKSNNGMPLALGVGASAGASVNGVFASIRSAPKQPRAPKPPKPHPLRNTHQPAIVTTTTQLVGGPGSTPEGYAMLHPQQDLSGQNVSYGGGGSDAYSSAATAASPDPYAADTSIGDPKNGTDGSVSPGGKKSKGLSLGWKIALGVGGVAFLYGYYQYRKVTAVYRHGKRIFGAAKALHRAIKG